MGLLRPEELSLIRLGLELKVGSIVTGTFHADLFASARAYADSMARKGRQDGHAGWGHRSAALQKIVPSHPSFFEITAESWDHFHEAEALQQYQQYGAVADDSTEIGPIGFYDAQTDDVPAAIAKSLIDSWRSSSGHWRILNDTVTYYGVGVAKGKRAYYGVEIVAK